VVLLSVGSVTPKTSRFSASQAVTSPDDSAPTTSPSSGEALDTSSFDPKIKARLKTLGLNIVNLPNQAFIKTEVGPTVGYLTVGKPAKLAATMPDPDHIHLEAASKDGSYTYDIDVSKRVVHEQSVTPNVTESHDQALAFSSEELIDIYNGLKRGDPAYAKWGTLRSYDVSKSPTLSKLFASYPPSVLKDMEYVDLAYPVSGSHQGITISGRAFLSPEADPVKHQGTVENELTAQAYWRYGEVLLDRTKWLWRDYSAMNDMIQGNWFAGDKYVASSNLQAMEAVSDVTSLAVDPEREIARIAGQSEAATDPTLQYHATANFMRDRLAEIFLRRSGQSVTDASIASMRTQMAPSLEGFPDTVIGKLALKPEEITWLQQQYLDWGVRLSEHYRSEGDKRYSGSWF